MKKLRKIIFALFLISVITFSIASILANQFSSVSPKPSDTDLRIGYVNLNQTFIPENDLLEFAKYDCDIWLFAEWNGNNFEYDSSFEKPYLRTFEIEDEKTFGFLVLAKENLNITAQEFDSANRPYACDYAKILVESPDFQIAFLHAPPFVPTCEYETRDYILDTLNALEKESPLQNKLLIGDLNTLSLSKSYKLILENGFSDIFKNNGLFKGSFGGATFMPPILRIDYAFGKGNIEVESAHRIKLHSSDHDGLLIDVKIGR